MGAVQKCRGWLLIAIFFAAVAAWAQSSNEAQALAANIYQGGDAAAAIQLLQDFVAAHPNDPGTRLELARYLSYSKRFAEANEQYQQVLRLQPGNLHARLGSAKILSWQGDWDHAIAAYDAILDRSPHFYDALVGKAFTLWWMGQKSDALTIFNRAARVHPSDREVENAVRELTAELGSKKETQSEAVKSITRTSMPRTQVSGSAASTAAMTSVQRVSSFPEPVTPAAALGPDRRFTFATTAIIVGLIGSLSLVGWYAWRNAQRASHAQAAADNHPANESPSAPAARTVSAPIVPLHRPKQVHALLLEDDLPVREFQRSVLTSLGSEVEIAETATEALRLFDEKRYQFVFLSTQFEGAAGYRRVLGAMQNKSSAPRLVITLQRHEVEPENLPGGHIVLRRPIRIGDLANLIVTNGSHLRVTEYTKAETQSA